jgi:putative effector of murein hydrolase LrgA (UPF0299 family)
MIPGLLLILFFQGAGELVSHAILPALPGPVIGLVLLLVHLNLKGQVDPQLAEVADGFGRHLGLLFVPAAVGVVLYLPQLRSNALGIATALLVSVCATLAVSAFIMRLFGTSSPPESVHADS